jgi:hypothetical protein
LFTKVNTSATSKTQTNALMLINLKILKGKLSKYKEEPMVQTKDGRSSILIRRQRLRLKV